MIRKFYCGVKTTATDLIFLPINPIYYKLCIGARHKVARRIPGPVADRIRRPPPSPIVVNRASATRPTALRPTFDQLFGAWQRRAYHHWKALRVGFRMVPALRKNNLAVGQESGRNRAGPRLGRRHALRDRYRRRIKASGVGPDLVGTGSTRSTSTCNRRRCSPNPDTYRQSFVRSWSVRIHSQPILDFYTIGYLRSGQTSITTVSRMY